MEYREVYCRDCKKVLGVYNIKYYTDDKIWEITQASHTSHIRNGHTLILRRIRD